MCQHPLTPSYEIVYVRHLSQIECAEDEAHQNRRPAWRLYLAVRGVCPDGIGVLGSGPSRGPDPQWPARSRSNPNETKLIIFYADFGHFAHLCQWEL